MKKIALAGGPGCGKTSMARRLVTHLYNDSEPSRNAQHVSEFARDYINACRLHQNGVFKPSLADQQLMYWSQLEREELIPESVEFLITDSPIWLGFVHSLPHVHHDNYQESTIYLSLYDSWMRHHFDRYDHTFILCREKPYFSDGTRGESEEHAIGLDRRVRAFLDLHGMPCSEISGSDEERLQTIVGELYEA